MKVYLGREGVKEKRGVLKEGREMSEEEDNVRKRRCEKRGKGILKKDQGKMDKKNSVEERKKIRRKKRQVIKR